MGEPVGSFVRDADGDVVGSAVDGLTVGLAVAVGLLVVGPPLIMGSLVGFCVGARVEGLGVGLRVVGFLVELDSDGDAD